MKNLFVPYEISTKLKEKGFNEPCFASYDIDGENLMTNNDGSLGRNSEILYGIYTPLYQQAIDWFREKHSIIIVDDTAEGWTSVKAWKFKVLIMLNIKGGPIITKFHKEENRVFEDYYEALNHAFEIAINLLT